MEIFGLSSNGLSSEAHFTNWGSFPLDALCWIFLVTLMGCKALFQGLSPPSKAVITDS